RGRGEIDLRLRERLGGADLGARRPERDRQTLAGEVALGVGDTQRQVLGGGRRPADRDRQGLEQEDQPDHGINRSSEIANESPRRATGGGRRAGEREGG